MKNPYNVIRPRVEPAPPLRGAERHAQGSRTLLLVGLFVGALALRPQLVGIGPLLPAIQRDLELSHAFAGTLPAIPVLCMGLLAASAGFVLRRAQAGWAVAGGLCAIAAFGALRSLAPSGPLLVMATFPIGAGIGLVRSCP